MITFNAKLKYYSLLKIKATQLHDGYKFRDNNNVLIINNGIVEAIVDKEMAGDDIKHIEGIVCPGFVNTHCHLELSYLHNKIPTNTGMVDFILAVLQGRATANEIIEEAIAKAEQQMMHNGIVAVGDICNTANTIVQKLNNNLHYTNFIEVSGFVHDAAQQRFDDGKLVQQQFLQNNLNATIVPHAPYSTSAALHQLIYNHNTSNAVTSLHYNESEAEKAFMINGSGDFLRLYQSLGLDINYWQGNATYQPKAHILVHNVVTDANNIVANKNAWYCLCPNANTYIGNGLPNVDALLQSGANICLGTDSLASNTQLSILAEIKTLQQHFTTIKMETLLQWATINGAMALGIEAHYGSFEKGKSGKYVVISD
jgi:aminodeoxyfutalosine deaminase